MEKIYVPLIILACAIIFLLAMKRQTRWYQPIAIGFFAIATIGFMITLIIHYERGGDLDDMLKYCGWYFFAFLAIAILGVIVLKAGINNAQRAAARRNTLDAPKARIGDGRITTDADDDAIDYSGDCITGTHKVNISKK